MSEWNHVYKWKIGDKREEYDRSVAWNKNYYNSVNMNQCKTIDACVEHALESGNHVAFVKYYIDKAKSHKDLLYHWFEKNIAERPCKIMKPVYWRDMTISYKTDDVYFYKSSTMYSWKDKRPPKEVIIQLGFYYQLNVEQVNEGLRWSNNELLYALDPLDAIAMFYLNLYANNNQLSGEEKIKHVKEKMYQYFHMANEKLLTDMVMIKKKNKASQEEKEYAPVVLAYRMPVGFDKIGTQIQEIYNHISPKTEKLLLPNEKPSKVIQDELTRFYEHKIEQGREVQFIDHFLADYTFGFLRYGYLFFREYLMKKETYKKKLYVTKYPLTLGITNSQLNSIGEDRTFPNKKFKMYFEERECAKEAYIKILNAIWKYNSLQYNANNLSAGYSIIENILSGRNILKANKSEYMYEDEHQEKEITDAYLFEIKEKRDFIKFCIACGWEDEISLLMRLGNYWEKDYVQSKEVEELEKTEVLLIYALKYRDRLLELWTEKWQSAPGGKDRDATEFLKKAKDDFPMIRLLLTISRDIQFSLEKIVKRTYKDELIKALIYPIGKACNDFWYNDCGETMQEEQGECVEI